MIGPAWQAWVEKAIGWLIPSVVNLKKDLAALTVRVTALEAKRIIPTPGPLSVTLKSENPMDVLNYTVNLPAVADPDVTKRELTVSGVLADGTTPLPGQVVNPGVKDATASISAPQNASVKLDLVDIDDAGNRSAPSSLHFTALDTLPPATPGTLSVTLTSETVVPDPTPAPAPAPAPVADPTPAPAPAGGA